MSIRALGKYLEEECKKRGWSLRELARRAGISSSTITDIVNGQRMHLRLGTVQALARALNDPPEHLMYIASAPDYLNPEDALVEELVAMFKVLSDERQKSILELTKTLYRLQQEEEERAKAIPSPRLTQAET